MKNPSITKFNELSLFIYDIDEGEKYIYSVGNANKLKLNDKELLSLYNENNSIENEKINDKKEKVIFLEDSIKKDLDEYFKINIETSDPLLSFLKKEYMENKNRVGFSSRKLAKKYYNETGNTVSHVTVNKTLKSLGMRYLKVSPKTNKILSDENLLSTMTVLKIISRCIKQKISIIYLDESTIININNNLKTWIIPGETLYSEIEPRKKYNLIMAINENGVIHYEINSQNTNDEIFLSFIKNLIIKIDEKNI